MSIYQVSSIGNIAIVMRKRHMFCSLLGNYHVSSTRNIAIVTRKRFMFCRLQGNYHASSTSKYTTWMRGHAPSQAYAPATRHFNSIYAQYGENWHGCQCMRIIIACSYPAPAAACPRPPTAAADEWIGCGRARAWGVC